MYVGAGVRSSAFKIIEFNLTGILLTQYIYVNLLILYRWGHKHFNVTYLFRLIDLCHNWLFRSTFHLSLLFQTVTMTDEFEKVSIHWSASFIQQGNMEAMTSSLGPMLFQYELIQITDSKQVHA